MNHRHAPGGLRVPPGPGVPRGLVIPADELVERFSRSSGPGGQHVNTSDSRVQLSLDLSTTTALDEDQRARVLQALAARVSGGVLTITAEEHRSQHRNRVAARERLADLLRGALAPPVPRRPTRPTRGSRRRRIQHEQRRAEIKRNRRRPDVD
ncbi:MAG: alternative ribosome rescue aminoacyl-tRNA hydrolase ArfB [Dietzia sp.]